MKKILFLLPLLLISCFDDNGNYILKFDNSYVEVSDSAQKDTVYLYATQNWVGTVYSDSTWATVTPMSGTLPDGVPATFRIVIDVQKNNDTLPRTMILHVRDNANECYTNMQLLQKGAEKAKN